MTPLLKTIIFFDLFDFPLTSFEVRKYCSRKMRLGEVIDILEDLKNKGEIEEKNGFYFLPGRQEIIQTRSRRYAEADKKIKKALLIAKIFSFFPYIKMIAMTGFKGSHNLRKDGDIDLFIITSKNKIWTTRFFCVFLVKILNLRPKPDNKKDKICLSFYTDENNSDLKNFLLDEKDGRDRDFVYWLAGFLPIYDEKKNWQKFCRANTWLKKRLPSFSWPHLHPRRMIKPKKINFFSKKYFMPSCEGLVRKIQLKILPPELKEQMNKGKHVVINNNVLKLHSRDSREEVRKKYQQLKRSIEK